MRQPPSEGASKLSVACRNHSSTCRAKHSISSSQLSGWGSGATVPPVSGFVTGGAQQAASSCLLDRKLCLQRYPIGSEQRAHDGGSVEGNNLVLTRNSLIKILFYR